MFSRFLSFLPKRTFSGTFSASRALWRRRYTSEPAQTVLPLGKLEERRLAISFTCKSCEHRNHHTMSHHSYTKGIVIVECPHCTNRHLIADNLGWFPGEPRNVEEAAKAKGEQVRWAQNE